MRRLIEAMLLLGAKVEQGMEMGTFEKDLKGHG